MALKPIQHGTGYEHSMNSMNSKDVNRTQQRNQQQLSQIDVTATSVAQSTKSLFKQSGKNQNPNEDSGKHTQATETQIRAAVAEANFKATRTRCEFSVDDATKRISIKVIDKESDNVIREIPAEESLEMLAKIWELAGILVDEKR